MKYFKFSIKRTYFGFTVRLSIPLYVSKGDYYDIYKDEEYSGLFVVGRVFEVAWVKKNSTFLDMWCERVAARTFRKGPNFRSQPWRLGFGNREVAHNGQPE